MGFTFLLSSDAADPSTAYLDRLAAHRRGEVPREPMLQTFLVVDVAATLVGRVSVVTSGTP